MKTTILLLEKVMRLAARTGAFTLAEMECLKDDFVDDFGQGETDCGVIVQNGFSGRLDGMIYYGPAPISTTAWYVWWLMVDPEVQTKGIGRKLLEEYEQRIKLKGARLSLIETSDVAPAQAAARLFYLANGYRVKTRIEDYYAPGDAKLIFVKYF